ncbi:hypothetical protein [Clostridium sp.]|uniref:hypothetical protein n=1 Tax=Clostridium sp. TaxID=1506 RepID=UPI00262F981A|nr:hypothetical protein [Clostridium sp.]
MKSNIAKIDWKRLREGKDVKCPICKEGILITPYDPKTSKFFMCNKCGMKINMD